MAELLDHPFIAALIGGSLIGLSAAAMLALAGRVTGISGFIYESFVNGLKTDGWRLAFLAGLLSGGLILRMAQPAFFANTAGTPTLVLILAGVLVGFGTRLGGGCTSGHGICGVSRLSPRSLVATAIFLGIGILTATCVARWSLF